MEAEMKKHFVLVHGSCHGAWCWYQVVTLLESDGHKVTALDLAASGKNTTKQLHQVRCISDYSEPLMEFMAALPEEERVILVGHSIGGLNNSLAMERFPQKIAAAVFLAAFMPGPNLPFLDIIKENKPGTDNPQDNEYTYEKGPENPPTTVLFGPKYAAATLYQRSRIQDITLATLLMRPAPLFNYPETLGGLLLTKENYGSVRRAYIVCSEDRGMGENQRWMIERNPPDYVQELVGADHMAMLSKPSELCSFLIEIANKYS